MNNSVLDTRNVLRSFNPNECHLKSHDEVYFVEGRYVDLANTKNKDPHTLYFGKSKTSSLLSGLFLGDIELTSKVRDVSLASSNGNVTLSIKYINEDGKLASVKTVLASSNNLTDLKKLINNINSSLSKNIKAIEKQINIIDSSVIDINKHLSTLDASVNILLSTKVSIKKEEPTYENGFKSVYSILNGDKSNPDSAAIEVTDMSLKKMVYDGSTNALNAIMLPDTVKDYADGLIILSDNTNIVTDDTAELIEAKIAKKVSVDMAGYDEYIKYEINTDSSVNDRLEFVEDTLKWEKI